MVDFVNKKLYFTHLKKDQCQLPKIAGNNNIYIYIIKDTVNLYSVITMKFQK